MGKGFKVQSPVCNGCHDVSMMFINPKNNTFLNIGSVDYRCIINGISKSQAVDLLQKTHLSKKVENYNTEKNYWL